MNDQTSVPLLHLLTFFLQAFSLRQQLVPHWNPAHPEGLVGVDSDSVEVLDLLHPLELLELSVVELEVEVESVGGGTTTVGVDVDSVVVDSVVVSLLPPPGLQTAQDGM